MEHVKEVSEHGLGRRRMASAFHISTPLPGSCPVLMESSCISPASVFRVSGRGTARILLGEAGVNRTDCPGTGAMA